MYFHVYLPACKMVVISERKLVRYENVEGKLGNIVQSLKLLGVFQILLLQANT